MTWKPHIIEVEWGPASVRYIHMCERMYDKTTERRTAFNAVSDIWFMGGQFDESEFDESDWSVTEVDIVHGGLEKHELSEGELNYIEKWYRSHRVIYNTPEYLKNIDAVLEILVPYILKRKKERIGYDYMRWRQ
jgi:hypothetical protein